MNSCGILPSSSKCTRANELDSLRAHRSTEFRDRAICRARVMLLDRMSSARCAFAPTRFLMHTASATHLFRHVASYAFFMNAFLVAIVLSRPTIASAGGDCDQGPVPGTYLKRVESAPQTILSGGQLTTIIFEDMPAPASFVWPVFRAEASGRSVHPEPKQSWGNHGRLPFSSTGRASERERMVFTRRWGSGSKCGSRAGAGRPWP